MESAAFIKGIESVTGKWCKQVKAEERHESARINRQWAMTRRYTMTLRRAAWRVMERAYMKASGGGKLPAHARQVFYAARPEILSLSDRDSLDAAYFTQTLLPDYIAEHGVNWDVVYDARGHFTEPHSTEGSVGLGTISDRNYVAGIGRARDDSVITVGAMRYPTSGPKNRFGAVLFVEWAVKVARILERNPVAAITRRNEAEDTRKERRALTVDEGYRLLAVSGPRRLFYSVQLWTGLRVGEAAAMEWRDLELDSDRPCIRLRAATTKASGQTSCRCTWIWLTCFGKRSRPSQNRQGDCSRLCQVSPRSRGGGMNGS